MHFRFVNALVLKGKGNVLSYCQTDKLAVSILKDSADSPAYFVYITFFGFYPVYFQAPFNMSAKRMGNKSVYATAES